MKNVKLVIGGAMVAAIVNGNQLFVNVADLLTNKGLFVNPDDLVNEVLPRCNYNAADLVAANQINNELTTLERECSELFVYHDEKVKQLRVLRQQLHKRVNAGERNEAQANINRCKVHADEINKTLKEKQQRIDTLREALTTLNTNADTVNADELAVLF